MLPPRWPLREGRPYRVANCLHCGRAFPTQDGKTRFCSRAHQCAAWRAVAMLRGSHYYDPTTHYFVRKP